MYALSTLIWQLTYVLSIISIDITWGTDLCRLCYVANSHFRNTKYIHPTHYFLKNKEKKLSTSKFFAFVFRRKNIDIQWDLRNVANSSSSSFVPKESQKKEGLWLMEIVENSDHILLISMELLTSAIWSREVALEKNKKTEGKVCLCMGIIDNRAFHFTKVVKSLYTLAILSFEFDNFSIYFIYNRKVSTPCQTKGEMATSTNPHCVLMSHSTMVGLQSRYVMKGFI